MKKICIITQCSLPVPTTKGGAVETLVEYIINENEEKEKFNFTIISVEDEKAKNIAKKYKNTKFIYVKQHSVIINKILMLFYKVLKHLKIYIPFSLEFKGALKKIKEIDEQDYYVFEAGPTTQLPALNKSIPKEKLLVHVHWDGMSNNRKDKCFSYLIPVSDYIGHQWQKNTERPWSKIKPLYNCAKVDLFTKTISENEKAELRKELNIPLDNKVIIFTGRIVKEKGVKELLEAYLQLKNNNVTLLMIGSANFGANTNTKYEQEISELINNSNRSIIFTGFVHQTELYKYYNIADISVIPSLFQDPAPLVCIEAQATGTPLIATKVGGIPEYVAENSAILVEKDEKLVASLAKEIDILLDDEERCRIMSEAGILNALKYSTNKYFDDFCNIINQIENEENNRNEE